jgi:hypothetical protein
MAVLYVFPVANTEFIQFNDQNNDYITSIHYSELSFGLDNNANVQFSHRRESAQLFPIQAAPFAEVLNEAGTPYSAVSLTAFVAAFTAALPLSGAAAGGGGGGSAPDIATYELQLDADNNNKLVRVLTVFDPVTNVPTRSFFELDGVTPYVPTDPNAVINADTFLKDIAQSTTAIQSSTGDIDLKLANLFTALGLAVNNPPSDPQTPVNYIQNITVASGSDIPINIAAGLRSVQIIALVGTFTINFGSDITYPLSTADGGSIPAFTLEAPVGRTLPAINYVINDGSTVLYSSISA